MTSKRSSMRPVGLLALVVLIVFGAPTAALAQTSSTHAPRPSTSWTTVGVLHSVMRHRVTVESTADEAIHSYRIGVFTTVCYQPNLCLQSGNTSDLLPGATVTAQVATDKRRVAHASTIFLTSVSDTVRIDSVDGDVITGHSTRSGATSTILRRPFTILVDERGAVTGGIPNLEIGSVLYFTGLAGFDNGSPVTIAARLFPERPRPRA